MLTLDRYLGMHFFTAGAGGNPMMYVNLIWAWGHPEVYILILPAFGIFSEVVPTFSEKRLFGYISMVWALIAHHGSLLSSSGCTISLRWVQVLMSMLFRNHDDVDCHPTGVKIFNWLFTKFRGRVHFTSPMLWFFAFVLNFTRRRDDRSSALFAACRLSSA